MRRYATLHLQVHAKNRPPHRCFGGYQGRGGICFCRMAGSTLFFGDGLVFVVTRFTCRNKFLKEIHGRPMEELNIQKNLPGTKCWLEYTFGRFYHLNQWRLAILH